jgi:chain length determinant protein EpsF
MNLQQLVLILRSRWLLAGGIFAGAVAFMLAVTLVLPKQYIATASVIADNRSDPLANANASAAADQTAMAYMATQVAIINSDRVVGDVVAHVRADPDLNLEQEWTKATNGKTDFVTWFTKRLHRALKVAPTGEGSVIAISVKWPGAKAAATLANALAYSYINTSIELRVMPAKQYASWFDEQAVTLRADLETKQKRLNDFLDSNDIVPTNERIDTESARLAELSNQLVSVQTQMIENRTSLREGLKDTNATYEVLQSPLIAGLKADLARAEARQQNISTTLGTSHPEYQRNQAEINSLQQRIDDESHNVVASFGNKSHLNERRETELTAALEAQKKRLLELKRTRDQVALLDADVEGARRNLDAVSQRRAQTSLQGATQQSTVTLLAAAVTPDEASSPRVSLNGALGIFFGTVFGIGAAMLREHGDRRVRSADELEGLLADIPVLGRIPLVPIPYHLGAEVHLLGSGT